MERQSWQPAADPAAARAATLAAAQLPAPLTRLSCLDDLVLSDNNLQAARLTVGGRGGLPAAAAVGRRRCGAAEGTAVTPPLRCCLPSSSAPQMLSRLTTLQQLTMMGCNMQVGAGGPACCARPPTQASHASHRTPSPAAPLSLRPIPTAAQCLPPAISALRELRVLYLGALRCALPRCAALPCVSTCTATPACFRRQSTSAGATTLPLPPADMGIQAPAGPEVPPMHRQCDALLGPLERLSILSMGACHLQVCVCGWWVGGWVGGVWVVGWGGC